MPRTDTTHRATPSSLARWFIAPRDVSYVEGEAEREEIIDDLHRFEQFATNRDLVLLATERGRALLRPDHAFPDSVVTIIYAPHGSDRLVSFWMNWRSLDGLLSALKTRGEAVDFDELLLNERVKVG